MRTIRVQRSIYRNGNDEIDEVVFRGDEIKHIKRGYIEILNGGLTVAILKTWDNVVFADNVISDSSPVV